MAARSSRSPRSKKATKKKSAAKSSPAQGSTKKASKKPATKSKKPAVKKREPAATRPARSAGSAASPPASLGGVHFDTTAVRNLLALGGVVHPKTKEPLSEALVLGIGGGLGAGYGFCPSVTRHGTGAGVSVVARRHSASFDGTFHKNVLDRLGVSYETKEFSTPSAGQKALTAVVDTGQPVLFWSSRELSYDRSDGGWCGGGMSAWSGVVVGLDEKAGSAVVLDLPTEPLRATLESLQTARASICTHKNRILRLTNGKPLTAKALKDAVLQGLRDFVLGQREPHIKTYSLEGLLQLAKMMPNDANKNGWLRAFPDGRIALALGELFTTVEAENGGGLMRPLFGDFLEEAAEILGKKALLRCASDYRDLGAGWTALAEAALPDPIPRFRRMKELLREIPTLFREKGPRGLAARDKAVAELEALRKDLVADFPLSPERTRALLEDLSARVLALHEEELSALDRVEAAIG